MFKRLSEKPYRLMSIISFIYLMLTIILNIFADFSYKDSVYPFAQIISFIVEGIVMLIFGFTIFFYNKHFIYYAGLELLVFLNLYSGSIYTALFIASILLVLLLTESIIISSKHILIYSIIELGKLAIVIPYGVSDFFNYAGLTLFALCTIGCTNLLFRHAYSKKDTESLCLDDLKLSDRQKNCIKEIVLNNTTIKALAITYNVSESAIKKDLAHIYKILGITGKADLKALFIDYKF